MKYFIYFLMFIVSCNTSKVLNDIEFDSKQAKVLDSIAKQIFIDPEKVNNIYYEDKNKVSVADGIMLYISSKELKYKYNAFKMNWDSIYFKGKYEIFYNNKFKSEKTHYTTGAINNGITVGVSFAWHRNRWIINVIFPFGYDETNEL